MRRLYTQSNVSYRIYIWISGEDLFFWDEMSLTIDVKYDAQKMPFEGFIDYGKEEIEDNNTEFTDQLADAHTDRHGSSLSLFSPLKQRNLVT
jgi:hypothetical protein